MNWGDLKNAIGKVAPVAGSLLGGPAGGAVGSLIAGALGVEDSPKTVAQAMRSDPEAALKIRKVETEHAQEMRRLHLEAETARMAQVNKTMRAEAASNDPYVRRWRPTWGYVTAAAWMVQSIAILVVSVGGMVAALKGESEAASVLFSGAEGLIAALTAQWAVALAVLGVNVTSRSKDKQVSAGQKPTGLLDILKR